jgi:hypothetical protein
MGTGDPKVRNWLEAPHMRCRFATIALHHVLFEDVSEYDQSVISASGVGSNFLVAIDDSKAEHSAVTRLREEAACTAVSNPEDEVCQLLRRDFSPARNTLQSSVISSRSTIASRTSIGFDVYSLMLITSHSFYLRDNKTTPLPQVAHRTI